MPGIKINRWAAQEGDSYPFGVAWMKEEAAYSFALYSKHATGVTLLLYSGWEEPVKGMAYSVKGRSVVILIRS